MSQHALGPFPGSDPGPSTHPRGPPNLNQISVVPPPQGLPQNPVPGGQRRLRTPPAHRTPGSDESPGDVGDGTGVDGDGMGPGSPHDAVPGGRTRGGRAAGMSNDEWARQRKDNHVSPQHSSGSLFSASLDPYHRRIVHHADHLVSFLTPIRSYGVTDLSFRFGFNRKKWSAEDGGTSMKASTNLGESCPMGRGRRQKAQSFNARCNTYTTSRRTRPGTLKSGRWRSC